MRGMKLSTTILLPAMICALAACTEPQTPTSDGAGGPAGSGTGTPAAPPTAAPGGSEAPSPTAAASTGTAADELTAPWSLTLLQTGGIAAMRMETVVDTASRHITYGGLRNQNPETRDLSADEIQSLERAIEEARFTGFPGKIKGGAIADAFTYTITVKVGGREYTVSWEDGASVPDSYSRLQTSVDTLRTSKFDGRSPKAAPTM